MRILLYIVVCISWCVACLGYFLRLPYSLCHRYYQKRFKEVMPI